MSEKVVEIDGIRYFTLLEKPNNQIASPLILLCHALMSNLHMYDRTVSDLHKAGFATLRFEYAGHNRTPAPRGAEPGLHLDDIVRHMHQIVQERTSHTHVAGVIGCSVGGVLALRYAMMFPSDTDAAISVTAPSISAPEAFKDLWADRIKQFEADVKTDQNILRPLTVERWVPEGRPEDDGVRAEALTHVKTCSLQGYKALALAISDYDYAGDIDKLAAVRCLVIAGSEDRSSSASALQQLAGKIEGAQFVCIDRAGHLPSMQRPAEFNKTVLDFLDGVNAPRS